jgi:hypothetical protein
VNIVLTLLTDHSLEETTALLPSKVVALADLRRRESSDSESEPELKKRSKYKAFSMSPLYKPQPPVFKFMKDPSAKTTEEVKRD